MRPVELTQTGAGTTVPIPMDIRLDPQNSTIQCRVLADPSPSPSPSASPSPAAGYVVYTTDSNVWGQFPWTTTPDPEEWLWTPHPDFVDEMSGATVPKTEDWVGNLAFPPTAVRMEVLGDETVQIRVVQSGF